jgi:hypothetical protein
MRQSSYSNHPTLNETAGYVHARRTDVGVPLPIPLSPVRSTTCASALPPSLRADTSLGLANVRSRDAEHSLRAPEPALSQQVSNQTRANPRRRTEALAQGCRKDTENSSCGRRLLRCEPPIHRVLVRPGSFLLNPRIRPSVGGQSCVVSCPLRAQRREVLSGAMSSTRGCRNLSACSGYRVSRRSTLGGQSSRD